MSHDFEEELAILPSMNQLGRGRAAQGDTAEHERPRMKSDLLAAFFSLFSDKGNRVQLL